MNFFKSLFFGKYKTNENYFFESSWQDISIERDNGKLSILLKRNLNAQKTIILAHPMIKTGKYFFNEYGHADLYYENGYNVVVFDFNGFGKSADNGFLFKEDILDVFEKVKHEIPDAKIGFHGVSFGASQIILAAIEIQDQIEGLIIESAVSSNLDYYKGRALNLYYILNLFNTLFPKKNAHNLYYNQIQKIKELRILFIYGEKDVKTPKWMGEKLFENAVSPNKKIVVFDTTHLNTINEVEEYADLVTRFWK